MVWTMKIDKKILGIYVGTEVCTINLFANPILKTFYAPLVLYLKGGLLASTANVRLG
jgi:hypothetical protein